MCQDGLLQDQHLPIVRVIFVVQNWKPASKRDRTKTQPIPDDFIPAGVTDFTITLSVRVQHLQAGRRASRTDPTPWKRTSSARGRLPVRSGQGRGGQRLDQLHNRPASGVARRGSSCSHNIWATRQQRALALHPECLTSGYQTHDAW